MTPIEWKSEAQGRWHREMFGCKGRCARSQVGWKEESNSKRGRGCLQLNHSHASRCCAELSAVPLAFLQLGNPASHSAQLSSRSTRAEIEKRIGLNRCVAMDGAEGGAVEAEMKAAVLMMPCVRCEAESNLGAQDSAMENSECGRRGVCGRVRRLVELW